MCGIMNCQAGLYLLIFAFLLSRAQAKRNLIVLLRNFSGTIMDPSFIQELSCVAYKIRPHPTFNVRFMLAKPAPEFHMHFLLDIIKSDNSVIKMGNTKFDGCKFLSSMYSHTNYAKVLKRIRKQSNLPRKCPLPANKLFEIRNYTATASDYPPAVPEFTFRITLKILKNDAVMALVFFIASTSY